MGSISAKAKEAEGGDLVRPTMACQERECWVLVAIPHDVVIVLLRELVEWRTEIGKEAIEGEGVRSATGWGDGIRYYGRNGVGHSRPIWRLSVGILRNVSDIWGIGF